MLRSGGPLLLRSGGPLLLSLPLLLQSVGPFLLLSSLPLLLLSGLPLLLLSSLPLLHQSAVLLLPLSRRRCLLTLLRTLFAPNLSLYKVDYRPRRPPSPRLNRLSILKPDHLRILRHLILCHQLAILRSIYRRKLNMTQTLGSLIKVRLQSFAVGAPLCIEHY